MVTAVIVLYNPDIETIHNQYRSLLGQISNIVYVDNGSININESLESLRNIESEILPFTIIQNMENHGLGRAQNQGIHRALENNADFILLLDHDSVIREDFTANLIKQYQLLSKKMRIGAVGPIYINESTGETYPITKYWGPFIKRIIPTKGPVEASCLISSGSLISISVLKDVGFMNEDLFVDYIDIEWSYRTRAKGYKLFAIPTAIMNHQIGDKRISFLGRKISMHSPLRRYFLTRNSIYMLKCPYISLGYKIRESIFNIARLLVFSLLSNKKKEYLKYAFIGLKDGLKGKFGPSSI